MIGKAKPKASKLESESQKSAISRLRLSHSVSDTDSDIDNDYAVRISELRFFRDEWKQLAIITALLSLSVWICTCDFFHDDRMELRSHVAHVFVLKCYVRPYSIVIVM